MLCLVTKQEEEKNLCYITLINEEISNNSHEYYYDID